MSNTIAEWKWFWSTSRVLWINNEKRCRIFFYNISFSKMKQRFNSSNVNSNVNRHNCRFWSYTHSHWMLKFHTQYQEKINI